MDYPDGDHAEHPPPSPEFAYPDIDETVHYPWQGPQSTVPGEAPLQSVIDPRLYRDLFTRSESHLPDQNGMDFEEDGENAVDYDQMDDSAEDSNYEYSAEETSTSVDAPSLLVRSCYC